MVSMLLRYDYSAHTLARFGNVLFHPDKITLKLRNHPVRGTVALEFNNNQVIVFVSAKQVNLTRWSAVADAGRFGAIWCKHIS